MKRIQPDVNPDAGTNVANIMLYKNGRNFFLVTCVVLLCVFTFRVPCCDVHIKTTVGSSLPPVVCRSAHVIFTIFVFVYVQWCPTHIVLCFSFVFHLLVHPTLPVSLDCPFVIAHWYSLTFIYPFNWKIEIIPYTRKVQIHHKTVITDRHK